MANQINAENDRTPTSDEESFNSAPKVFSKATLGVIAVAIIFLIIASLLFSAFFSSAGG
jgi:hypothetical protein